MSDERIARKGAKTRESASSLAPWKFPKNTLEDTLAVAKALEEKFAGNPTKAEDLVKAVGFNKETDWRFQDLVNNYRLEGGSFVGLSITNRLSS